MRRTLALPLLLQLACSGSPPPPPPAPAAPAAPPAAEPAPAWPWIELSGKKRKETVLTGRAPDGGKKYEIRTTPVHAALAASDGGAYLVLEEPSRDSPGRSEPMRSLVRIDAEGKEAWRADLGMGGWEWRLFVDKNRLYAFDLWSSSSEGNRRFHVLDTATGRQEWKAALPPGISDAGVGGGVVVAVDDGAVMHVLLERGHGWDALVQLFPTTDPTSARKADRKVAVGPDGTVLTGAADGSLIAFDAGGKPLYQLGVRGAVSRIEARSDGGFAVLTRDGGTTLLGPGGVVRREGPALPEAAPSVPGRVVDRREVDAWERDSGARAAPSAAAWKPTAAYRVRPQEGLRKVRSVVALAPGDVWALGLAPVSPSGEDFDVRLFHSDGKAWSDEGAPSVPFPREAFAEGAPAAPSSFVPRRLARGPRGALLVLGFRQAGELRRPCVLERTSAGLRERRELFGLLAKIETGWNSLPSYAASPSGREVFCDGKPRVCVDFGRGAAPKILEDDEKQRIEGIDGEVAGRYGVTSTPLVFAGETLWKANAWASGAGVLGLGGTAFVRWDGKSALRREAPAAFTSVWAGAEDDVWLAGADGVARFDGERFWRVLGLTGPFPAGLSVTGSGRGDVWVFGEAGLFHVTPDPAAGPDIEGTAAPAPPATTTSTQLAVAGTDTAYRLERAVIEVDGQRPLRAAIGVAEGPGGVLWFHEGARVVEYDGTRARVLYQAPRPGPFYCWYAPEPDCNLCTACTDRGPHLLGCQRCAAPAAAGEGALLSEQGWRTIKGGRAADDDLPLSSITSVATGPSGSIWAVSAGDDDLPHALVQGARGRQLVPGLPAAAYMDVAARAADDAWFAGGLTTGEHEGRARPEGEGTLVHFDGRTFTRHRAPDGALLSVAAAGPGEAWAVGVGGGVLHVKGSTVRALHVAREGGGPRPILRAAAAAGPGEVWLAGDGSTLLRWDGSAFRRVDTSAAGKEAALSAVVAPGAKGGWVVGPGGIWKVVRK